MTLAVVLVLALFVGVALGALGGGGSILTVPILVYVADLEPKQAIATSLLVVGVTSCVGAVTHARAGRIRWRTGTLFGTGGMAGALVGGILGGLVPGRLLLVGFAVMMIATSAAMLRGGAALQPAEDVKVVRAVVDGIGVGLITGLVGAGGGFLVVPALALLGGLSMPTAIGTSLVVIALKSGAGLAGYLTSVSIPWGLATAVLAAAILGSVVGGRITGAVDEDRLRNMFGWFVLTIGTFMLLEQAAPSSWLLPGAVVLALGVVAVGGWRWSVARSGVRAPRRLARKPG
ncbi:sulfite exporter TauE/SafE family protein [Nocardioides caldifontis]|uniref:sulfite exporter TauE/SafE family protein n=1 Tax=Nocardioides caldifontis TaxID=2588938 RepID=UPI0011DFC9B2|nr:sulfite exporter TauE/SafE family protein [Nocardioides caldifontis]